MVRGKIEKTAGLLIALYVVICSLVYVPDWDTVGAAAGCGMLRRLGYSFFHASAIHATINAWCFVSILFLYNVTWLHMAVAYAIAVAAPNIAVF